jgi:hypothetical protein
VPEEDGVDGAEAAFGFGEEFFGRVAAGFGVVEGTVPDEKLDLRKSALGPCEIGIHVVGFIEAELGAAFLTPGLEAGDPGRIGGIGGAGEEDFGRRWRNGERHGAVGRDEGVAGFPFIGMERDGAGEKNYEKSCRPERRRARKEVHREVRIREEGKEFSEGIGRGDLNCYTD